MPYVSLYSPAVTESQILTYPTVCIVGETPAFFACEPRLGLRPHSSTTCHTKNSLHENTIFGLPPQIIINAYFPRTSKCLLRLGLRLRSLTLFVKSNLTIFGLRPQIDGCLFFPPHIFIKRQRKQTQSKIGILYVRKLSETDKSVKIKICI